MTMSKARILIVDDHPMMLEYLSGAVAKALPDAVVRTAGDLQTALERARESAAHIGWAPVPPEA